MTCGGPLPAPWGEPAHVRFSASHGNSARRPSGALCAARQTRQSAGCTWSNGQFRGAAPAADFAGPLCEWSRRRATQASDCRETGFHGPAERPDRPDRANAPGMPCPRETRRRAAAWPTPWAPGPAYNCEPVPSSTTPHRQTSPSVWTRCSGQCWMRSMPIPTWHCCWCRVLPQTPAITASSTACWWP